MNATEHWKQAEALLVMADVMMLQTDVRLTKTRIKLAHAHFEMAIYMFGLDKFHPVSRMQREVQDS